MKTIAIIKKTNEKKCDMVLSGPYTWHEDEATNIFKEIIPYLLKDKKEYFVVIIQNNKIIQTKTAEQFLKDGDM